MPTYLADIVAAHRRAAAADDRDPDALLAGALATPVPPPFAAALAGGSLSVVAEVKRRSPSKGDLAPGLDPAAIAAAYAAGGASCLSVLTDRDYFGGAPADLVAALDDGELRRFLDAAATLALDALVEVHDEAELDRALAAGARLVGVNQRDLATFEVDPERAEHLATGIPEGVVALAESGIADGRDAARLAAAGFQAVLVGEALVRATDPSAAVAAMAGHPVTPRRAGARSPQR